MKNLIRVPICFLFLFFTGSLFAQTNFFQPVPARGLPSPTGVVKTIKKFSVVQLNEAAMRNYLSQAPMEFRNNGVTVPLEIPLPDGTTETFGMVESPVLSPEIAAQHPEIKTYTGNGTRNKAAIIRLSLTSSGFNAILINVNGDRTVYFEQYSKDDASIYFNYFTEDATHPENYNLGWCGVTDEHDRDHPTNPQAESSLVGEVLRTYRIAIAGNGEFTGNYGGSAANAFNAIVGYVNRMNIVYRNELSVQFTLVSGMNLVYTDPNTDPYTNSDHGAMLAQNQTNLDAIIGSGNYDVGQVMAYTGNGFTPSGLAYLGAVCNNFLKAGGVSAEGDPGFNSQLYNDKVLFHEIGHMFNMTHNYNSTLGVCTSRNQPTSPEPRAGATIMSYASLCAADNYIQSFQIGTFHNFHTVSYASAVTYITNFGGCATTVNTSNLPPVVTMPSNYTIPKSTPFTLTGSATDPNGDALTYSWEGTNNGTVAPPTATTLADPAQPPFFRSYPPTTSNTRTYPILSAILDGTNQAIGDKLPSIGVATTHRLTVRDNNPAGGGVSNGTVTVTVDVNIGPFLETTNLAGSYPAGSMQTITWSVNGTNVATPNVKISLSTDGGQTFPFTLAASTPNDGTQAVTLPNVQTTLARIKVEAIGNIFFDISNSNFTISIPGCTAAAGNICPANAMTLPQGDPGLNLGLSNFYGTAITQFDFNLSLASPVGPLAIATVQNGTICQSNWGDEHYVTFDFAVSETGSYQFLEPSVSLAYSVFLANGYNPAMPCAGTFVGSNAWGSVQWNSLRTLNLTQCTAYKLVVWTVENNDYGNHTVTINGPGSVFTSNAVPANTGYTYVAVNQATNLIAAVSATSSFTSLAAGTYKIYGASYKNGGLAPPANSNPATWVGQTQTAIQTSECVVFSLNNKMLTVTAPPCPTLATAPANVSITNSTCVSGCTVSGGVIAAPGGTPCPAGSTLQYSVNGGAWTTTLPTYNQTGPAQSIQTRCQCDSNNSQVSPASVAVTTVPGTCTTPGQPTITITNNVCPSTTGSISASGCGAGTVVEYATNAAGPWTTTAPAYTNAAFTVFARCRNTTTGCVSTSASATTAPTACCPTLTSAPANVSITNSTCTTGCTVSGGNIAAPGGTPCPAGSTLQYSVNGGAWTTTLPTYNQTGPAQSIQTRCQCDSNNSQVSPASVAVTTVPGTCTTPGQPTITITNNVCPSTTGSISASGCGAGTVLEYATNAAGPWTTTAPAYTNAAFTVFARCRNTTTGCVSTSASATTAPTACSPCGITAITVSNYGSCNSQNNTNPGDDTFTANITVTFFSPPSTGTLNVSGDWTGSIPVSALSGGSYTFANVSMSADGGPISLTAQFSANQSCSLTNNNAGTAPGPCCYVAITNVAVTNVSCQGSGNGSIVITAVGTGQLGYSINGGQSYSLSGVFNNLTPGTYNIQVVVFGTPTCSTSSTAIVNTNGTSQTWYKDIDNDGYSDGVTLTSCSQPQGFKLAANLLATSGDCNDYDAVQHPGQTWYKDTDNDGYSNGTTIIACLKPAGYQVAALLTATSGDCNDNNAAVNPGATEVCNGIDDNCNGLVDENTSGGLTYNGNVVFTTQAQVNAWSACYSVINGNLTIKNSGINSLMPLINIVQVTGTVTIQSTSLTSMAGLNGLTTVGGGLIIKTNTQLTTLDGLDAVATVAGNLQVFFNLNLSDCCAIYDLINGGVGGTISISLNKTGCESVPAVNADCNGSILAPPGNNVLQSELLEGKDRPKSMSIFPNPANDVVNVAISGEFESGWVKVIDWTGRIVSQQKLEENASGLSFDSSNWRKGVYVIQIRLDGEFLTRKVVLE